jgi:hypothetical protein
MYGPKPWYFAINAECIILKIKKINLKNRKKLKKRMSSERDDRCIFTFGDGRIEIPSLNTERWGSLIPTMAASWFGLAHSNDTAARP